MFSEACDSYSVQVGGGGIFGPISFVGVGYPGVEYLGVGVYPTISRNHKNGRYASYWNAFLLVIRWGQVWWLSIWRKHSVGKISFYFTLNLRE